MELYLQWCPPCMAAGLAIQLAVLLLTRRVQAKTPLRFLFLAVPPILWLLFSRYTLWHSFAVSGELWIVMLLFSPLLLMCCLALTPLPMAAILGWALAWGLFELWDGRKRRRP